MNQGKTAEYDHLEVGSRICARRKKLGFSRKYMAEHLGRSFKYYADIERGSCGMSAETMLGIASLLDMSLDYMMLGLDAGRYESTDEDTAVLECLSRRDAPQREKALRILRAFLTE